MPDEETIREIVRDELQSQSSTTRRGLLAMLGGGAAAGAMAGSASGEVTSDQALSVGDVTANTYRISENRYGGVESARSELATELGDADAGAKFAAQDTGAEYHWTGSAWELMDGKTKSFSTEQTHNTHHVSADDDPQTVIDDANPGDTIEFLATKHEIDYVPSITKPLTLRGESFNAGGRDLSSFDGAYLSQTTSADKLLDITVNKKAIHIHNLGFEYADSVSSTGHGIVCDSESDGSGGKTLGLQEAHWTNVAVRGVDPDKYCYRFINVQYNLFEAISYKRGGGTEWVIEGQPIHPANSYVINLRGDTEPMEDGADGIHFTADGDSLNFITFIEPQIAFEPKADQVSSQSFVDYTKLNGGDVREVAFMGPLWESDVPGLNLPSGTRIWNLQGVSTGLDLSGVTLADFGSTLVNDKTVRSEIIEGARLRADAEGNARLEFQRDGTLESKIYNAAGAISLQDEDGNHRARYQAPDGTNRWSVNTSGGQKLQPQDLSRASLGFDADQRIYLHDGSNSLSLVGGGSQSDAGYYRYDSSADAWSYIG